MYITFFSSDCISQFLACNFWKCVSFSIRTVSRDMQNFSRYTATIAIVFKSYVQNYSQSSWYLVLSTVTDTTCYQHFSYLDVKCKSICDTKNSVCGRVTFHKYGGEWRFTPSGIWYHVIC
jgi:hypothetical protein